MQAKKIILDILKNIEEINNIDLSEIAILPISDKIEGHYCLNFAFKYNLSKEIQILIKNQLEKNDLIEKVDIINKYINITFTEKYFYNSIKNILNSKLPNIGNEEMVNVEYCSVNPTGYLHVGHARNAILGDSIARILKKANYKITKEYYVNDGGNQIKLLGQSVYSRYCELNNIEYTFPENGYIGEEIYDVAKKLPKNIKLEEVEKFAVEYFVKNIKKDLKEMNINHDIWTNESDIIKSKYIEKAIEIFKQKDVIKYGVLGEKKVNKGEISENDLILLKTSNFGDEQDRPLTKSNGDWTYFAPDIGYHLNKIERGFLKMICILGSDHDSYAKRMKIAVQCLDSEAKYESVLCQMVSFDQHGELVKFSKRKGNSIRVRDFIKKISPDILRFMMLEKSNDTQFVFNYENAINITMKNPIFYCQYAYARACSLLKKTEDLKDNNNYIIYENNDIFFKHKEIQNLIISLEQFESTLHESALKLAPHKIANYLKKISEKIHRIWQIGKEDNHYRIIIKDNNLTKNRLQLIKSFIKISKECFECLGIQNKESM